ncbi:MAG: GFA family protein [Alphaproteobacteria bacterium]|nr:GFA family protein [Alphaproteobacteria bacterium]
MSGFEVSCPCGSVLVRIGGEPVAQFYCHCADCQRAHGAAYVAESIYESKAVSITSGETVSLVLRTTPRLSCGQCGTRLYADLVDDGLRGLNAYLLPPDVFQPTLHINCGDAVAPVADALPHYRNKPVEFGGDGERMDW